MGLDMYLSKKSYVKNWDFYPAEKKVGITVKLNGKKHPHINPKRIVYITEELAYWRKANAIHKWFVDNCQEGKDDCREYDVTRAKLQELYDACVLVKDGHVENGYTFDDKGKKVSFLKPGKVVENASVAEELLPTTSGFFFGGTDYDQYYMEDILSTIKQLETELETEYIGGIMSEPEYTYRASW